MAESLAFSHQPKIALYPNPLHLLSVLSKAARSPPWLYDIVQSSNQRGTFHRLSSPVRFTVMKGCRNRPQCVALNLGRAIFT
ncbi:hypothetical protein FA13DRAFT_1735251 [Coprinellus micaceus]|uniref:Uncharacterized protein n=1 Tax=Coprinellus micaceus TaxID=71717 RepID=A0A4Y7T4N4_COPMI|nr:hypothetical protein FA13DRAFT_1735251 [Coprinellus micaceus]